ncbi:Aste57867_10500 [Aphanomyces stellatus]|uniref:Aste57867_10500 protein n=1 Tax=Aphanomyces stellatus TaxID=120398 RepID=A0A485KQI4_9STRA|nr:hypothetical protein As57867_010460 [Aphanomyces stellatus]VFT87373.1 Aste57867_10500 [Aphanomyces stellatus]
MGFRHAHAAAVAATAGVLVAHTSAVWHDHEYGQFESMSGIGVWVDVDTPAAARTKHSSRGDLWTLVMSDEFNVDGRTFKAGDDPIWVALDLPDGVNAAVEMYNSSNVYTQGGSLVNKVDEGSVNATYYNQWLEVPGYETRTMYYTAGMVQSWNKFCFQGGLIEVAAKLPGAINNVTDDEHNSITTNPNAILKYKDPDTNITTKLSPTDLVVDKDYYPTWPGIWLMGNLGRALFSASTTRMWPWTFDECDHTYEPHQMISACNATPGYGLLPYRGRGAPEIDILEGGGSGISSSIQIAPGMPDHYRRFPVVKGGADTNQYSYTDIYCIYGKYCKTLGANIPDAPYDFFKQARGHESWYHGLRYAANNRCTPDPKAVQQYDQVANSQKFPSSISSNTFNPYQMSAAQDVHADLGIIDGNPKNHWGINQNGTCFPIVNGYIGAFLCDPDSKNPKCESPRKEGVADTKQMIPFEYQMDAISANWAIGHDAYTTFYTYQVEWVMGAQGYIRWSLEGSPIFEIPSSALTSPPQNNKTDNPKKVMIEEPMYIIFNVALAKAWGATPPNVGIGGCRGNATHPAPGSAGYIKSNNICDSFPMYMEIDYIRIYQDKGAESTMALGCDPPTHPTKEWIDGHLSWYTNENNTHKVVTGRATCLVDPDCSANSGVRTGRCILPVKGQSGRCECAKGWGGPRCTKYLGEANPRGYGPKLLYPIVLASACVAAVILSCVARWRWLNKATTLAQATATALPSKATDDDAAELLQPRARRYYGPANPSSQSREIGPTVS